jgi:hypothetical protein
MSEEDYIVTINDPGLTKSLGEPTGELRWLTVSTASQVGWTLQQGWKITEYRGGKVVGRRYEWRDVPKVPAATA